jgi:hypothetical protein
VRTPAVLLEESEAVMVKPVVREEPLGIVVQDGGDSHAAPQIMMWYWADENEIPEWEKA